MQSSLHYPAHGKSAGDLMVLAGACWTEAMRRERGGVSLAPQEGEESCSPGFGSGLAPAGAGLWSSPCTALPPMGTASIRGTATSLLLEIWPLILSGTDDGCNLGILAHAFVINFSQAARCFWPAHPEARDCPLHAFLGIWSGQVGELHTIGRCQFSGQCWGSVHRSPPSGG